MRAMKRDREGERRVRVSMVEVEVGVEPAEGSIEEGVAAVEAEEGEVGVEVEEEANIVMRKRTRDRFLDR